jgi:hypothetical protein
VMGRVKERPPSNGRASRKHQQSGNQQQRDGKSLH